MDERRAHLREHLARHAGDDVDAERRPHAALEQAAGRRQAVPHQQLDERRDRDGAAGLGDQVELLVGRVRAVDVGRVRPHDPGLVHAEDVVDVDARQAHADVDGDPDAELARQRPVVLRGLGRDVPERARGHRERQQLVVGGEVLLADAADVVGMAPVAVRPPAVVARDAVGVDAADAGVLEPVHGLVGVLGRVRDVRPVEQRRDPGVERLERAGVVPDVDVLGPVVEPDLAEHVVEVGVERAAREHAAHRRLPRVPVRVDEARQHELPGRVDLLGIADVELRADLDDLPVLDQDVGVRDLADLRIHRHDKTASDDQTLAHRPAPAPAKPAPALLLSSVEPTLMFPPRVLREAFINTVQRD